MKSQAELTLKVTRVGDDDGAGRLQVVQRGRHFEKYKLEIWEMVVVGGKEDVGAE